MLALIDLEERETRWMRRSEVKEGEKRRWIEGGRGSEGDRNSEDKGREQKRMKRQEEGR